MPQSRRRKLIARSPTGVVAERLLFQLRGHGFLGVGDGEPVEEAGMIERALAVIGDVADLERGRVGAGRQHHGRDRQAVFAGEVEVALVVRRAAEDGAGAVFHQHEVGDVDRQMRPAQRVGDLQAGVVAHLLLGLDLGGGGAAAPAFLDEGGERRVVGGERLGQRMAGREGEEGGAEQRVRAGGVDLDLARQLRSRVLQREAHVEALGTADPVALHEADLVRPAVQRVQAVEQLLRQRGDAEEPLGELAALDQRAGAPAAPVDHLLIGEHGVVDRVPVRPRSRR